MPTLSTFIFTSLPYDIQVLVMNQLPFEELVSFRHSCQHFFLLTDTLEHQQIKTNRHITVRTVIYDPKKFEFQRRIPGIPYVPKYLSTSGFWNYFNYKVELYLEKVQDDDQENFLSKLKKLPFKFINVHYFDIPLNLMNDLLSHLTYVKKSTIDNYKFYTNEFLCSNAIQHLQGDAVIGGHVQPSGNYKRDIDPSLVPVKGINHIIRHWLEGDYQFDELFLTPITDCTSFVDIMKDIEYVTIFDENDHLSTPLRSLELQKLKQVNDALKYCVAVQRPNSSQVCLVSINWNKMFLEPCQQEEIIQKAIKNNFMPRMGEAYFEECIRTVGQHNLF